MPVSNFIHLFLLTLALCAAASCEREAPPPAQPSVAAGHSTHATPPPRVVALSPAIAVALRDIGLADLIVGRHGFDAWTDQSIPVCGDQSGIDYEALLAAKPTHVLVQWGQRDLPTRLADLAERHRWTVRSFNPLSLSEVREMAGVLSDLFPRGTIDEGAHDEELPPWLAAMDAAWRKQDGERAAAGRVLVLHGVSPPNALGPGSFHYQVLERIGGTPALTQGSPYITLDLEDVRALAPDAIVLLSPRPPGSPSPAAAMTAPELAAAIGPLSRLDIPAVRNARIAVIDDPECLLPSTSMVRFAQELARVLDGWAQPR
jgi:ABC-type Fe3+-hydroxamate transport system substrate-binding protein